MILFDFDCMPIKALTFFGRILMENLFQYTLTGPSYHHNRRAIQERERVERDRERIHARERELAAQYDLHDDEIISNRGHLNTMPATTHIRNTNEERELLHERERDDRYPMHAAQSSHLASASRRDRTADDYSPHRGGGSNRRVLNAM